MTMCVLERTDEGLRHLDRLLDDTLAVRRRCEKPLLTAELQRLERLVDWSGAAPLAWRAAVRGRADELALWLYGVAIGVAAAGLTDEALGLLAVLPDVPAGAQGRRELLAELIAAQAEAELDLKQAV